MSTYDEKTSSPGVDDESKGQDGKEPSGYKGNNPATAGPGNTQVSSNTPEGAKGHIDPSAPGDTGITPGSMNEE